MLKKYLAALWADWVARMSGVASIVLAFLAAYFEFIVKHGKVALRMTAAICFVFASYRVWAKEHHALVAKEDELRRVVAEKDTRSAKREYKIERLKELVRSGNESRWVNLFDNKTSLRVRSYRGETVSFLKQYFSEDHARLYEERGLEALEEFLKDLLVE